MSAMVPKGFTWHVDGMTLQLDGRSIAHMTLLGIGAKVRVTVGHWGARPGRHAFLNTQDGAKRYIEAWACKWATEIRAGVALSDAAGVVGYGPVGQPRGGDIPPDPRGRRRPRGARLG